MILNNSQRSAIVIVIILLALNIGLHPQASELTSTNTSPIVKLGRILSYVLIPILILEQWKRFIYVATKSPSFLFLIGITVFSFFWSDNPGTTIENGKGLIRTTLFGIYLATQYTIREQIELFSKAIGIAASLSLLICLALPGIGISETTGVETPGWRGVFYHKNDLGDVMSTGVILLFLYSQQESRDRWIKWLGICICIPLLILANAKTPLIGLVTMLALIPFHKILRQKYTLKVPLLIIAIICVGALAGWLTSNFDFFLSSIGKDPGLNGRRDLWVIIIKMIQKHPLLGYGYTGFWSNSANVDQVHREYFSSWKPGHAHNGFLTLLLDVGVVGLVLFLISFFNAFKDSVLFARFSKSAEGIWPIQVLSALIIANVSGNFILNAYGSIIWLLYTTIVFSLSIHKDRVKRQSYLKHELKQVPDSIVSSQKTPALFHNSE